MPRDGSVLNARPTRCCLDKAIDRMRGHAAAHAELAHFLMISGDYEAARKQAQHATSIDPNSAEAQNVTAFIFLCLNLPGEALRYARNAIRLNPGAPEFYLTVMSIGSAIAQTSIPRCSRLCLLGRFCRLLFWMQL